MKPQDLQLFQGTLSHHRFAPKKHRFKYKVFQICLNLNTLEKLDVISPFWSSKHRNLVRFKRSNYMPSDVPLDAEVKQTILAQTGDQFDGEVFLLANLSYWGHCYNPACFYACYENEKLRYFICEIHNTPWGERFSYVHKTTIDSSDGEQTHVAEFAKAFHVSPFMPMDLHYQWRYKLSAEKAVITMDLSRNGKPVFNSTLSLNGQPLSAKAASWLPFRYPFMGVKVVVGIYWQALKLWIKGLHFYRHPKSGKTL